MNTDETPPCSTHPDAPHGFDRDGSHTAGRYVCDCEGWIPPEDSPPAAAPLAKPASPQGEDGERGGGEQPSSVPLQLPEPQSAVEWVRKSLVLGYGESGIEGSMGFRCLPKDDAFNLAHRCDEAEKIAVRALKDGSEAWMDNHMLRAQLAAAQARADEADESAKRWESIADGHIKTMQGLSEKLAAAQAEARELREELEQTVVFCEAHIERFKAGKRLDQMQLWEEMKVRAHNARAALTQHAKEGGR